MANKFLENLWVTYVDRSYQQIKDRVLTVLQAKVPEMTDHSETNIFVKMLSIWSGIAEMLGYYTDNMAREAYIGTCRLWESGVKIADMFDYPVRSKLPAYVDITFELPNPSAQDVTVPQNTRITGEDYDFSFYTVENLIIQAGQTSGVVGAVQSELVQNVNLGISDGSINQRHILPELGVAFGSVSVTVDADLWENKSSLAYSKPEDLQFIASMNTDRQVYVKFGDDIKGKIPPNGSDIFVDYRLTKGEAGNTVVAGALVNIEDNISLPPDVSEITCFNVKSAAGGSDIESLEELKSRIPKSLRTLMRAVTRQDFQDIAELAPGVLKAGIYFQCGSPVNVFVQPVGGGTAPQSLLDEVDEWFDDKRIININTKAESAGIFLLDITVNAVALPGYQNANVQNDIITAIQELYTWGSKEISDTLYLSNIYQVIENTEGVKNSHIPTIVLRPFARPVVGGAELDWDCVVKDDAGNFDYTLEFTTASQFIVFKNNVFVGTYDVGNQIETPDLIFTVNSNFSIGDTWQFYAYESFVKTGILDMREYSAPIAGSLSIQVTGGI